MVDVKIDFDLDSLGKDINNIFLKQIPYVAHKSLNETVFKTSRDLRSIMPAFIQGGPVPFTKRGVLYSKSLHKRSLISRVFIPDAQWKYMRWVVDGGDKRWNKSKHGISKPIYENTKFNRYGNIPGKKRKEDLWREILNRSNKGRTAVPIKGALSKKQFIATINGTTGLWLRMGKGGRSKMKLLVVFNHKPVTYKKSFPFTKFAIKFGTRYFRKAFNKNLVDIVRKESRKLRVS